MPTAEILRAIAIDRANGRAADAGWSIVEKKSTAMVAMAVILPPDLLTYVGHIDDFEGLHLTLALFSPKDMDRVSPRTRALLLSGPSFPRPPHVTGVGSFATPGGPARVLLASAPGLEDYRRRVVEALAADGIPVNTTHGFTPHITIRYGGEPLEDLKRPWPLEMPARILAPGDGEPLRLKAARVVKSDEAKRLVTIVGYVSRDKANRLVPAEHTDDDGTVVDHSRETLSVDDLEEAMHAFARGDHDVDEMHENGVGEVDAPMRAEAVEWFVFTPNDIEALGPLGMDADFPECCILKIKIHDDDLWAKVQTGELPMLSLAGRFEETAP